MASFSVPRVSRSASRQEEGHVAPTCLELLPNNTTGESLPPRRDTGWGRAVPRVTGLIA